MNYGTTELNTTTKGKEVNSYKPTFGLDEHTIFLCHCDTSLPTDDSFNNIGLTVCDTYDLVDGKFNNGYKMNGGRIETDESNLLTFGKGDFTVEAWIYPLEDKEWHTYLSSHDNYKDFQLNLYYMVPKFYFNTIGSDTLSGVDKLPLKEWSHVAVCRKDGLLYMFVNGKLKSTQANDYDCKMKKLDIGMQQGSSGEALNGILDEIRISNIARWTKDFTPPEGPYVATMSFNIYNVTENFITFGINGKLSRVDRIKVYVDDKEVATYTDNYQYLKYDFSSCAKEGSIIKLTVTFDGEKYELSKVFPYPKLPPLDDAAGLTDIMQRDKEIVDLLELHKRRLSQILLLKGASVSPDDRLGDLVEKVLKLDSQGSDVNLLHNNSANTGFVFYRRATNGELAISPNLFKLICPKGGPTEVGSNSSFNMKNFDKIVFEIETSNETGEYWVAAGLHKTFAGFEDTIYKKLSGHTNGILELDISNDYSNRYIGVGGEGVDIQIKSIKLVHKV